VIFASRTAFTCHKTLRARNKLGEWQTLPLAAVTPAVYGCRAAARRIVKSDRSALTRSTVATEGGTVDAIPPLHGKRGRPRCRPVCVLGDRGYDAAGLRQGLRARHILPLLAKRRTKHGNGLGRHSRSLPLARLCLDLLAVAAQRLDEDLNRLPEPSKPG
jgi:hypothetical protein